MTDCAIIRVMKFYKEMDPTKRRIMILGAVAHDSAMEGMSSSLDACLREIDTIKQKRSPKVTAGKSSELKKR